MDSSKLILSSFAEFLAFANSYLTEMHTLQKRKNAPQIKIETENRKLLDSTASSSLVLYTRNGTRNGKQEDDPKQKQQHPSQPRSNDSNTSVASSSKFVHSGNKFANKCAEIFYYL